MAEQPRNTRRPFGWRGVLLLYALLSIRGWGRVWTVLQDQARFLALDHAPPMAVYIGYNSLTGCLFLVLCFGLWRKWCLLIRWHWYTLAAFVVVDILWQLVFVQNEYDRNRLLFTSIVWAVIIGVGFFFVHRPPFLNIATRSHDDRPSESKYEQH